MNRRERRHPRPGAGAGFAPKTYRVKMDVYAPTDPPLRDENRNTHHLSTGETPDEVWRAAVVDLTATLGFKGDLRLLAGLCMDLINRTTDEVRLATAGGILNGLGLTLIAEKGTIIASFEPKYPAFEPDGTRRAVSGLVLPGNSPLPPPPAPKPRAKRSATPSR